MRERLRRLAVPAVLGAAFLLCTVAYFWNASFAPDVHRGDGVYRPAIARGDGHLMYLQTLSLALDGDLDYADELKDFGNPWNQPKTATGRYGIPHPIGPPLVWTPVFWLAHGAAKILDVFGAGIEPHGYTRWHQIVIYLTTLAFSFGAMLLGWRLARRVVGGVWAPVYATVAVLLGTALLYYTTFMPAYAHAMDAFATAAFLAYWAATLGDRRPRRYAILGALVGAAAMVRITGWGLGVAVAFEVVVEAALVLRARRREGLGEAARLCGLGALALGTAFVAFVPQMIAWKVVYGEWLTSPMGPGFVRLSEPFVVELLWSSKNGWLSTHPIAYAGVVGLCFVPRSAWRVTAGLALVVVSQIWVNACVFDWWSGASFGQRRLCSLTIALVVGLAALCRFAAVHARRLPRWGRHAIACAVLGWFVVWNVSQVWALSKGKAAYGSVRPMCCGREPEVMKAIAQPVYDTIGNPFAIPASLWFALRYRVAPRRFDEAVGDFADMPEFDLYTRGEHRRQAMAWNIPGVNFERWIFEGLGKTQKHEGKPVRFTTGRRARVFLPFFLSEPKAMRLPFFVDGAAPARVRLLLDGDPIADHVEGPGWAELTAVTRTRSGMHELAIESDARLGVGALTIVIP